MEIFTRGYQFPRQITQLKWGYSIIQIDIIIDGSLERFISPWSTAPWSSSQPSLSLYFPSTSFSKVIAKTLCPSMFTLKIKRLHLSEGLSFKMVQWIWGCLGALLHNWKAFHPCSSLVELFWIIDRTKYWTQSLEIQAVEHLLSGCLIRKKDPPSSRDFSFTRK